MITRSLIVQCYNSCPCFCPGCYNFSTENQISIESIELFIKEYKKLYGLGKVTLSGGDPLMNDCIGELIDNLYEMGMEINVDTVGIVFLKKNFEEKFSSLRKISFLGIPIDGVTDETVQKFRKNFKFKHQIEILEKAKILVNNICINTVVHAGNIDEIEEIAKIIYNDPSITKWQLFQYMPIGPGGFSNRELYAVDDKRFSNLKELLMPSIIRKGLDVEYKSIGDRKDKYLILGSDGNLWLPQEGTSRRIIGSIFDDDILKELGGV